MRDGRRNSLLILLLVPLTACLPRTEDDLLSDEVHLMQPGPSPLAGGSASAPDSLLPILPAIYTSNAAGAVGQGDRRVLEQEIGEWYY